MTCGTELVSGTLTWRWRHFALFSGPEWHRVLELRTAIFVVEQECPYQEVDQKDIDSWHLEVAAQGMLIGTLRVLPPGVSYKECSIGRVAVQRNSRDAGCVLAKFFQHNQNVADRIAPLCDAQVFPIHNHVLSPRPS